MSESNLVPDTDAEVQERMLKIFGNINDGFGGCVAGIYRVRRQQGDSVKRRAIAPHGAKDEGK